MSFTDNAKAKISNGMESSLSAPLKVRIGLSALYFLTYLGLGVYWTYGNIYFRESGVSVAEIGILNALYYGVAIFGHPFFGYVYDKSSHKHITIGAIAVLALSLIHIYPAMVNLRK